MNPVRHEPVEGLNGIHVAHPTGECEETRTCFDWAQHERVSRRPTDFFRINDISIADILELPMQQSLQLVARTWGSVATIPEAVEFKTELEIRLKEFEEIPESGLTWDQVNSILKDGSGC
jgi:putative addiction module component (TIGR02574 family)